jgi:hypothetical protein
VAGGSPAREHDARRWFLGSAWTFIAYNVVGALVGWLAALPASNGQHGNVHDVGSQALYGNGTALSPPLWLLAIWALCVVAASRTGWLGKVGVLLTFLVVVFYASAGELGELTTSTSPLTGSKWDLVLVLGGLGMAIALIVILAGVYWVAVKVMGLALPSASAT